MTTETLSPRAKRIERALRDAPAQIILTDTAGEPVVASSGQWLAAFGARDIEQAITIAEGAAHGMGPHTPKKIADTIRTQRGNTATGEVLVDAGTQGDPAIAAARSAALSAIIEGLAVEGQRLAAKIAALRGRTSMRAHLRGNQAGNAYRLREAKREAKHHDRNDYHALVVGDAAFDLRIVRTALSVFGAKRGQLVAHGELDAAILVTEEGIALVMPFRR